LIEEVTAHVQRDSLEDAREICADGTYFLNNLRTYQLQEDSSTRGLSIRGRLQPEKKIGKLKK